MYVPAPAFTPPNYTMETPEKQRCSGVSNVNFEQISHNVLVSQLFNK